MSPVLTTDKMNTYKYRAKKNAREIIEGVIEAASDKDAIEQLSAMGYLPVRLEQAVPARDENRSSSRRKPTVRSRTITVFSRQLASLLRSGMPILKGLSIIREQSDNAHFKEVIGSIHDRIKEGGTFSSALSDYPSLFPPLYIALIRSGEDGGSLPGALLRIADYRAKQEELVSRFRMAMMYPALMALVGLCTVIFMFTFVMPRLTGIFLNMGQQLPLPTRVLISISQAVRQWGFALVVVAAAAALIAWKQSRTRAGRKIFGFVGLRIPLFGALLIKSEIARFSRTMETLLRNGIPILRAMEISIPVIGNEVIREQVGKSYKVLAEGGSLGKSLGNVPFFPAFTSNLIIVGEESGKLDEALSDVAAIYEAEADETLRVLANLLEPLMILGMGLVVGFIVVAMLLPVFEINVMAR